MASILFPKCPMNAIILRAYHKKQSECGIEELSFLLAILERKKAREMIFRNMPKRAAAQARIILVLRQIEARGEITLLRCNEEIILE
jgi:hypothetical protein